MAIFLLIAPSVRGMAFTSAVNSKQVRLDVRGGKNLLFFST